MNTRTRLLLIFAVLALAMLACGTVTVTNDAPITVRIGLVLPDGSVYGFDLAPGDSQTHESLESGSYSVGVRDSLEYRNALIRERESLVSEIFLKALSGETFHGELLALHEAVLFIEKTIEGLPDDNTVCSGVIPNYDLDDEDAEVAELHVSVTLNESTSKYVCVAD